MRTADECRARLFLLRAIEPPAPAVHAYVATHGPIDAATSIRAGTAPDDVRREVIRPFADIDTDLRQLDSGAARLVTPEDSHEWPHDRLDGSCAPLGLWVRGQASLRDIVQTAVTVTGARAASTDGERVATDFSYHLAKGGVVIVAGGSYGVDASAHRGALLAGGPTAVVLPSGIDVPHPHGNAPLFDSIVADGGLLLSEYRLGDQPTRQRFLARARLLAALSTATVIVEAGYRSGALAVARRAIELNRTVYGVPGPITSATSAGVHELIRSGRATLITSPDQIDYQQDPQ